MALNDLASKMKAAQEKANTLFDDIETTLKNDIFAMETVHHLQGNNEIVPFIERSKATLAKLKEWRNGQQIGAVPRSSSEPSRTSGLGSQMAAVESGKVIPR